MIVNGRLRIDNPPVANADSITLGEGGTVTSLVGGAASVLTNDTDLDLPHDTLIASTTPVSGPAYGTLTLNADGTFSYTHDGSENFVDQFTYEVSDATDAKSQATVTIKVTPINDHYPVLTSSEMPSVPEHTTAVVTLTATDADLPAQTVSFSITDGMDAVQFEIVSGELRFKTAPDLEHPADANTDNVYLVNVTADDGAGGTTVQSLSVAVTPVNDHHPVFTSSETPSVPEHTTAVVTLTATDADLPAQTVSFSITDGMDAVQFEIVSGELRFKTAPDLEHPADANTDNVYLVNVTADDGAGGTTVQNLSVTVVDVNEPPELAAINNRVTYQGRPLSFTATATDPDQPANTLTFSLDAAASALGMLIDPVTGTFDWTPSEVPGPGRYEVTITVTDNGSPPQSDAVVFTIEVAAYTWQNPRHPCDINGDGLVTALDVLLLINEINIRNSRDLAMAPPPTPSAPPFLDPSGDVWLTPADVLLVISYINNEGLGAIGGGPGGEGEQVGRLGVVAPALTGEADAAATISFAVDLQAIELEKAISAIAGDIAGARHP